MIKNSQILIIGYPLYVGQEIYNILKKKGYKKIIFKNKFDYNKHLNENYFQKIFKNNKIDYVFLLGADSGGIHKNLKYPTSLIYSNILLNSFVIKLSSRFKVKKLLFLSSSCVYPNTFSKSLKPKMILSGPLEDSSKSYAISKLAGMELCKAFKNEFNNNFISVIPSTIYGPKDKFFSEDSHVIPSLISKFYSSKKKNLKKIMLFGTGKAVRDFIYYSDLANAMIFLMKKYNGIDPINVSSNEKISILSLANKLKKITNYDGKIIFNQKDEGAKYKFLDTLEINNLGWKHKTSLEKGLKITYQEFLYNYQDKK